MSARFVAASVQYLINTAPAITAAPFTVGLWVHPTTISSSSRAFWFLGDTAASNHYWRFGTSLSQGKWLLASKAGGAEDPLFIGTASTAGFVFFVLRVASATNRRMSVLQADGSIAHGQQTTSLTPTGVDAMILGSQVTPSPFLNTDGRIGEFWYTNTDIQPDGGQLQDSTLRQLAMGGPFSLPHIAKDIIEYRSFRSRLDSRADAPDEVYHRGARQIWTNTNGVQLGPHPPAAAGYDSPLVDYTPMVLV